MDTAAPVRNTPQWGVVGSHRMEVHMKQLYSAMIRNAQSIDELEKIVELMADNDLLTNAEYCQLVDAAQTKINNWREST